MLIALGIDTGGTYTDAALVEYETGRVLATAKALTTRHDLSAGIDRAIRNVLQAHPTKVHLVSLSTTLATNAIVEGNGAPICALLIGYEGRIDPADLHRELGTDRYVLIPGGHRTDGEEWQPLDLAAARAAIIEHAPHVAAFAVSGYFGTRNPSHELLVQEMIGELTNLPVTCGHELTHRLDALRRATTVALNARLIPLLRDLIAAVERTLEATKIDAPLMVVKGDGSLMDAAMVMERPIETILSGPAASVVGAQHLAGNGSDADERTRGADELVVIDMGGTTTDIAVLSGGRPRLSPRGAQVGRWRTMVEAVDVHTVGLGGDSRVWLDPGRELQVGPRRVMPLSLLAAEYPAVTRQLEDRAAATAVNPIDGEYLLLQRAEWNSDGDHPPFESELFDALREGPCAMAQIHAIVRHPELYSRYLTRIERQGIVIRAGFTPTDAAHVLGHYREWHVPAARYGAELLARRIGTDFETLCERILSMTAEQIAREIVLKLLSDEGSNGHMGTDTALITRALRPPSDAALLCRLTVQPPLVAIGAPVRTYFPAVADLLHGRLRIPEHTGSANAIGAVVGSIVHRAHALVVPHEDEMGYRVHLPDRVCDFPTLDEATACAQEIGRDLAIEYAERAGAQAVRVQIVRRDRTAPVAEGWGDELYIQTEFEITAAGRPRIARE